MLRKPDVTSLRLAYRDVTVLLEVVCFSIFEAQHRFYFNVFRYTITHIVGIISMASSYFILSSFNEK